MRIIYGWVLWFVMVCIWSIYTLTGSEIASYAVAILGLAVIALSIEIITLTRPGGRLG